MHELSIALNIVEIVEEEAKKNNLVNIAKIEIEIGALSGVVIEALQMAMAEAIRGTLLEKAEIEYHHVNAIFKCNDCMNEYSGEYIYIPCPNCQSFNNQIVRGNELKISKIVLTQ